MSTAAVLMGGPFTAPPLLSGLILLVVLLLAVLLIGRVLALAGRVIRIALVIILVLWLLGMVGIGPL